MSKRYYLSNIIGTGDEFDPYRPAVADHNVPWAGTIPSDPVTGLPLFTWALVIVSAVNHGPLLGDSRIDSLPDFPLDGKVSAINTATKNAMLTKMQARGIDTTFVGGADGYRDVIRGIGQKLDAAFNENNFDVNG